METLICGFQMGWLARLSKVRLTSVDMTLIRLCQGMVSSSPPTVLTASEKSQLCGFIRSGPFGSWDRYQIDLKVRFNLQHFLSMCSLSPTPCLPLSTLLPLQCIVTIVTIVNIVTIGIISRKHVEGRTDEKGVEVGEEDQADSLY